MNNNTKDVILMIALFFIGLIGMMVYSTYKDVNKPICQDDYVIDKKLCSNIGSNVWICNMQEIKEEKQ
jgi:energy-converting hydrogenase Eha subunit C